MGSGPKKAQARNSSTAAGMQSSSFATDRLQAAVIEGGVFDPVYPRARMRMVCLSSRVEVFVDGYAGLGEQRAACSRASGKVAQLFGQAFSVLFAGALETFLQEVDALRAAEDLDGDHLGQRLPVLVPRGDQTRRQATLGITSARSDGRSALSKMINQFATGSPRRNALSTEATASSMPVADAGGRPQLRERRAAKVKEANQDRLVRGHPPDQVVISAVSPRVLGGQNSLSYTTHPWRA